MPEMLINVDDEDIADTNEAPRPKDKVVNDAGFGDLKAQLDKANKERDDERRRADGERQRRETAEAQSRRDRDAVVQARTETVEGRKIALTNAVQNQKTLLDSLEAEYAAAFDAGDSKKAASVQRKMAEAAGELKQIEAGLSSIETDEPESRRGKPHEGRVSADDKPAKRQPQTEDERFESYVTQFGPDAEAWLRKHPEAVTNVQRNKDLMAAHHTAVAKGYEPNSRAYFAHLDRQMGYGRGDAAADAIRRDNPLDDIDGEVENERHQRRDPMRSAPVSRGNGGGGNNSNAVSLTQGEVDAATNGSLVWNLGQTDHRGKRIEANDPRLGEPIGTYEMARRKKAMGKEGRYEVPFAS